MSNNFCNIAFSSMHRDTPLCIENRLARRSRTQQKFVTKRQVSGAALIVSLVILLVMTLLGLASIGTSRLEERMAGNARDANLSFQAAEAALVNAEQALLTGVLIFDGNTPGLYPNVTNDQQRYQDNGWDWANDAIEYDGTSINGLQQQPRYYIEFVGSTVAEDSLAIGTKPPRIINLYRITSLGIGASATSQTILQIVFTI